MLNLHEMQSQISFMVGRFQDTIKQFEELKKKIENSLNSIDLLSSKIDSAQKLSENLSLQLNDLQKKSIESSFSVDKRFDNLKLSIESQENNHNFVLGALEYIRKTEISLEEKLHSLMSGQKNFAQIGDIVDVKDKLEIQRKDIQSQLADSKQSHQDLKDNHERLKNNHADFSLSMIVTKKEIESFGNLSGKNSINLEILRDKCKHDMDAFKVFMQKYVSDLLTALPKCPLPISLDDAKNAMQSKLEPISLDAKNSNLRSINNESKITILEKKIEQLQLLLNKLQIQG